jgi:hypothetical protein
MSAAPRRAPLFFLAILIAIGTIGFAELRLRSSPLAERPPAERPTLLLLTGLPLLFNEDFSLSGGGSPALKRLQSRYRVVPISVASAAELAKGRLLLMAQPQAQTAENLVALDEWVRGGGGVLLFADPMLEWPSKRPFGDVTRPSPMFADTGLLQHWGVRLDAPDRRGPAQRRFGAYEVTALSPGSLHGACGISRDGLVAECRVGKGRATIIADADLLNVRSEADTNLDATQFELARLESK